MPLYKTITVSDTTRVYLWKITESERDLAKNVVLAANSSKRLQGMKSELHRKGFLSIRHLMAEEGYVDHDLDYDDMGKPHLKNGKCISISHSFEFTGIIVSDTDEVGMDIEKQREKILRIAHKFTPIEEYRTIANTDALIRKLTLVWGAKESLFKIYATPGLGFLRHIDIADFFLSDTGTTGKIHYKGKTTSFNISFLEFEGFICAYALKDQNA